MIFLACPQTSFRPTSHTMEYPIERSDIVNLQELEALRTAAPSKEDRVDIRGISIDMDAPVAVRAQHFLEQVKNPYAFKCGDSVQQFVLFKGDGHFSSVATFLKTFMDKGVGVYGIPGTLSNQLRDCCSWSKLINIVDEEDEVYQMNLLRNFRAIEKKGLVATFRKTVEHVVRVYSGNEYKYELILSEMIADGFVTRQAVRLNGNEFMSISPVWEKINGELMPVLACV